MCAYLTVEGGIAVPPVLGSALTVRAGLGGFAGRVLRPGDLVPLAQGQAPPRPERRLPTPPAAEGGQPIRVILGPQHEYFTAEAVAALLGAEFRISTSADRMGMRLDGPRLRHRQGWDIVSDAIATGAIQVPGSGQPILLLADHETTGGYRKIATVISADRRRRPPPARRPGALRRGPQSTKATPRARRRAAADRSPDRRVRADRRRRRPRPYQALRRQPDQRRRQRLRMTRKPHSRRQAAPFTTNPGCHGGLVPAIQRLASGQTRRGSPGRSR